MVALVYAFVSLAFANKWVEYKFGLEYGDDVYDFSGNGRHGTNGNLDSSSKAKMTDRGMYFNGDKYHIGVPDSYSGPHLGSLFSIVIWTMAKDQDGIIFRRGPGTSNNNFMILGDSSQSSIIFKNSYSSSISTISCGNYGIGSWTLSIVIYQSSAFKLLTQDCVSSLMTKTYQEQNDNYFTYLGSPYSSAFKGFIWYFLITESSESVSTYTSSGSFTSCSLGPCVSCSFAVIDPDYGTVCLSSVTDASLNSNSQSCGSTYGCSLTSTYSCTGCGFTCLFNQQTGSCSCISNTGLTSSSSCNCRPSYSLKNQLCCSSKCSGCSSPSTCTGCNDINAEVVSGSCSCKSGYFLSSTTSTTSYCSSCKASCKSCTSASDCLSCFDPNSEVISNACLCKAGYYGTPSSTSTSSCFPCSSGCSSCTSTGCNSCYDSNAVIIGSNCQCKPGYFGTPSSTSSSSCYPCPSKCSACESGSTCTTCFDQYAEFLNGQCVCKSGYFGIASADNSAGCQVCKAMCSSCTSADDCLSCYDQNSELSGNSCVCKTAHYGSPSTTAVSSCIACDIKCSACTSSQCLNCYDQGSVVSGTTCECRPGFYGTPVTSWVASNCFACPVKCLACSSASSCTTCFDQFAEFLNGECVCKAGYFGSASSSSSPGCSSCKSKCSACSNTLDCLACFDPNSEVKNNECFCKKGFFGSPSNVAGASSCGLCPTGCSDCISSSDCSLCFDPNASFDGTSCKCNSGFFGTTSLTVTQTCFSCPSKCKICSTSTECSTCFDVNASFDTGVCACKSKFYGTPSSDSVSASGCFACSSSCASCLSLQECLNCLDLNAEVKNGLCKCKTGFFGLPSDGVSIGCQSCRIGCKSCSSGLDCSECFDPSAIILNNVCVCNSGYYGNIVDSSISCFECKQGCSSCTGPKDCLGCYDVNSEIIESQCKCREGYFSQSASSKCQACKADCLKCSSLNECQKCFDPKAFISNGLCLCIEGYFKSGSSCEPCPEECRTCSDSKKCTSCTALNAVPNIDSVCICKSGFFNESQLTSESSCSACLPECAECESELFCKTCKSKEAILTDLSHCVCPEGFFNTSSLVSEDSCKRCNSSCKTCSDLNTCTECAGENTVLASGQCICKKKFYANDDAVDCLPCPGNTIEGKCKSFCPQGEGWINKSCVGCPELCTECDSINNCLKCVNNSELQTGSCVCSKGFLSSGPECLPSFFYFSFTQIQLNTLKIRFTDEPIESLTKNDLSLSVGGNWTRFQFEEINRMVYLLIIDQNLQFNDTNEVIIYIQKYPLISLENSQLHKYSANLSISFKKVAQEEVSPAAQSLAGFAIGSAATANPSSCWVLINTLQMITYLPFNSVPYTENLQDFSSSLSNYNIIPNILSLTLDHESSSEPYKPAKFCNFKSSVFWVNFGRFFTIFVIFLGFLPFLYLGSYLSLTKRLSSNLIQQYKFSFFIRFWLVAYIPVGIYSFIQLNSEVEKPAAGYVNFVSAAVFLAAVIATPFALGFFLYRNRNLLTNKDYRARFGSLFEELKQEPDLASLMYYPILTTRKLLFVIIQCCVWKSPGSQSGLNALLTLTHAGYLIYFRPLNSYLPLISELLGQVCVFICIISTTFLYDDKNLFSVKDIENSFKYTVLATISLQTGICFYYFSKFLLNLWKKYKTRRSEFKHSTTISSAREPEVTFIHGRTGSRVGLENIEKD